MPQLRYLTAGESHGRELIGIVEGCPAGLPLTAGYIDHQLARRWQGYGRGGRSRIERDLVTIASGVRFSKTMGSPIALRIPNAAYEGDRAGWPENMSVEGYGEEIDPVTMPRPGHADLVGWQKYGFASIDGRPDIRPVIERASARETAMRVACCSVARALLNEIGIQVGSHVVSIGTVGYESPERYHADRDQLLIGGAEDLAHAADESDVRILDASLSKEAIEHIKATKQAGDSLGGVYEVVVTGVPAGLGSYVHWDRKLDGLLAQAILSIQAQKAVEIGDGLAAASSPGSAVHDEIEIREDGRLTRASNRAGGIEGGMSTGEPIVVRGFMKPIPTLIKPLRSVDLATSESRPTRYERSDVTSVPAASVVAEAVVAQVIANAVLDRFGGDTLEELVRRADEARAGR